MAKFTLSNMRCPVARIGTHNMYIVIITALSLTLFFNMVFCLFLVRAGARATCEIERLEKELQKIKSIA